MGFTKSVIGIKVCTAAAEENVGFRNAMIRGSIIGKQLLIKPPNLMGYHSVNAYPSNIDRIKSMVRNSFYKLM